jgi:FG-GAP-like repeat/FG-GAP repeat
MSGRRNSRSTLPGTRSARRPNSVRLRLEPLEERRTPTVSATLAGTVSFAVGPNVNVSRLPGNNQEQTIIQNPVSPNQMFAFANTESVSIFAARSNDAGRTWLPANGSDFLIADGGDSLPLACCDPSLAWDRFGNLFIVYLTDPGNVEVALSTDGGATIRPLATLGSTNSDQPTVAVGAGPGGAGSVWVTYDDGGIQAVGATVTALGVVGAFGAPQAVTGVQQFGDITIGPTGQVTVTGQSDTQIQVATDPDGLGPAGFGAAVVATTTNVARFDFIPPQPDRAVDAEAGLAYATNPSGLFPGRLYLVYTDAPSAASADTNIFVRFSNDNGASWSAPVRVNDDVTTRSQFNPRLYVDPDTGAIAVSFYDCRNDPTNHNAVQVFAAISTNGGVSFSPNVRVSAGSSNEDGSEPPQGGNADLDYGDFSGLSFFGGSLYPFWADNSNSTGDNPDGTLARMDVYTARVVPLFAGGQTVTAAGAAAADTYVLRLDSSGTYLQVYENNPALSGRPTFTGTLAAVTRLVINGNGGNDQLILDYSNGNPVPVGGITFNGGAGIDILQLSGAPAASLFATGAGAGVLAVPGGGDITLAAVEQVNAALAGGAFSFTATNNPDAIGIGPAAGGAQITSAASPTIAISGASSVTVDGAGGADVFNVTAAGVAVPLIIQGGPPTTAPGDVLNVNFVGTPRPTLIVTGPDSGIYVFPGHPSITFNGIETNLSPQVRTRGPQAIVAVGVDSGAPPIVQVIDAETGQLLYRILAYPVGFSGGVRVAVGDVNGDLTPDIITAPGRGAAPLIKVFDGRTGALARAFLAYPSSVTTGVFVAAGDVNGDGFADIITAPDRGAVPLVSVFNGRTGALIRAFIAFSPGFRGGLHVAAGLVNADKFAEIIVAPAGFGPPIVETFDGRTGAVAGAFLAYPPTLRNGVWLATGDVNADGLDDIITGPNGPAPPLVRTFDAGGNPVLTFRAFQAFQPNGISDGLVMSGGARVAAVDVNRDGVPEIIVAQGPGSPALLVEYGTLPLSLLGIVEAFPAGFGRGLTIGASA